MAIRSENCSTSISIGEALRYVFFQVTSIQTNTGLATHDFDRWNPTGRCVLFVLMFVGGCAGSTSCSIKVIRYVLFFKVLGIEIERSFRPNVVRPLRLAGQTVGAGQVQHTVLTYFGVFATVFVLGWLGLLLSEPDQAWEADGHTVSAKTLDCSSAVAATINGVGPGLGTVGPTRNYAHFSSASKVLLTFLMLVGRLEIFPILVLFVPGFWKNQ